LNFKFGDLELQINNLINFLQDKEQSGEGLSSAEDVQRLIGELKEIETGLFE